MIVHEGIEPKLIQLTPITGMLDPAKWQFWAVIQARLMVVMPASICSATALACSGSLENTAEPKPKLESLAKAMASSSLATR